MAVTVKALIPAKEAELVQTTQYTSTNCRAIIDKFTATNTGAAAATLSVHLVTAAGTAVSSNQIVKEKSLAAGETYAFPEVVGHVLEPSGFISTLASAAGIAIRSSGREVT